MLKEMCRNCTYYVAYYRQFSSGYGKLNHGHCQKQCEPKKCNETCSAYYSNEKKEKRKEEMMFKQLAQALTSINEITQIMNEKKKNSF